MNAVTTENVTRGKTYHALQIDTLCCQQKEDNHDMSTVCTTVVKSMSWDEETSNSAKSKPFLSYAWINSSVSVS